MKYCDTTKVKVRRTIKENVYDMEVNKHYAGRWTGSTDIFGVYYETGEHSFFEGKDNKLIVKGNKPDLLERIYDFNPDLLQI